MKIYACSLVVLGHFYQSMVTANILPNSFLYGWFNTTIYYFHVPLFFICSGYLYQRSTEVRTISQWKTLVAKKGLSLGIPYFVFSLITWGIKFVLSDSVNKEVGGMFETLLLAPLSPYWYLYALFLLFCVTMTIKTKKEAQILLLLSITMKVVSCIWRFDICAVQYLLDNAIWFVLGMVLCFSNSIERLNQVKSKYVAFGGCGFIVASVLLYMYPVWKSGVSFIMGLVGCFVTILLAIKVGNVCTNSRRIGFLSSYTLPVFLMHTIFAAGIRIVLFKVGIGNSALHILLGLTVSFAGPVLAAIVMAKVKWMEFLLYPTKFIRIGGGQNVKKT